MNIQSPTTLLNNIQFMRSRLRSDKQTLMDIKQQFNHYTKKPRPPPIHTIHEESITSHSEYHSLNKENLDDKNNRGKIVDIKREHQKEVNRLKHQHQEVIEDIVRQHKIEIQENDKLWSSKLEEQSTYISLLEEQTSSPIQTQR